ncbi:hypothetical protein LO763_22780 [Glycomyces sp. A-F 0318]|uniref:hypothetical protein n=1 Tax=Glycomyces amatae TaxID=2881355 RepID=UPI001E5AE223|nr:hypothetical protein [Glycomyces amatae]MCD0446445.1 hypothetical protein [Glycomyces amatae]
MLSNTIVSLIRTYVPLGVGITVTWAATEYGIILDQDTSTALAVGATGAVAAIYAAIVRGLEARWPKLGVLLGMIGAPVYGDQALTASKPIYDENGRVVEVQTITRWPRP